MSITRSFSMSRGRILRMVALALVLCLPVATLLAGRHCARAAIAIEEYNVPTAGSGPVDLAMGPDGHFWYTEYFGNKIGRCNLAGTTVSEFALPNAGSTPALIVQGPDGNMWFTEFGGHRIGRLTPGGALTEYPTPTAGSEPWGITVGPDGALWFAERGSAGIGRCTTDGVITEFPIPGGNGPREITRGPDGNLWFTEQAGNSVGRMTPTGAVTRYPLPNANSGPYGICMGPDGNLWFAESQGNRIGRCTPAGVITEFAIPTAGTGPTGITAGPDGALWFCERNAGAIGRCSLTADITETAVPTPLSAPMELTIAPDGSIWFGETTQNRLGRLEGYATPAWYLAEGSTEWGFSTYVTIENPNAVEVHAIVTYMPTGAAPISEIVTLPAASQTTLTSDHLVAAMGGPRDFSTRIICAEDLTIAVDRTMQWTGPGAAAPETHGSVGVTSPARRWYLAEGSSAWGFECFLLVQNPTAYPASCRVTYMIEGEAPQTFVKDVAANSRDTFNMADDIGSKDASIEVSANVPVIAERAMYRYDRREGHDSIGTPAPALGYFLAEGTTAWGFTTYLLVQNPNPEPVDVVVTYQTAAGAFPQPVFTMAPESRETILVNDVMPGVDLSTTVEGSRPIIAERAMYLQSPTGEICHDSIGFTATHNAFLMPDGQTTGGCETYTLVQNPNAVPVNIRIDYFMEGGVDNVVRNYTMDANSRQTFYMNDVVDGRCAAKVTCTSGQRIMCERAMYWNGRQAAADTIGGYGD